MPNINAIPGGAPPSVKPAPQSPALLAAKATARNRTRQIIDRHTAAPFTSWAAIGTILSTEVPTSFKLQPLTFTTVNNFCNWYINSTAERIEAALKAGDAANESMAKISFAKEDLIPFNLKPPYRSINQQRKAVTQIVHELYLERHTNAVLVPLNTGIGKTAIAASVAIYLQEKNYFGAGDFGVYNIIYLVPNRVKIQVKREFLAMGVKDMARAVHVVSYSEIRTKGFLQRFKKVTEERFGAQTDAYKWILPPPCLIIVDECHYIKKLASKCTRVVQGWLSSQHTRWIFMSATPAVVVNDLATFAMATRMKFGGQPITHNNWKEFAWSVSGKDPMKASATAMGAVKDWFGPAIINVPNDPRKFKSRNSVKLIKMREEDRPTYEQAEEAWLEACERKGKIPSERGRVLAATTMFRKAEERIKAPYFADLAIEAHAAGFAPVIGVSYIDTIKRTVERLTRQGHSRANMSIIWGGEKLITDDMVFSLEEFMRMQKRVEKLENGVYDLDRKDAAKYRRTLKHFTERWMIKESPEDQRARIEWLREMKLEAQSLEQQQEEIDRFQSGKTEFCLFTLPAGGTGVSLDHRYEHVRPRKTFGTITFYVEEIIQFFGRAYRGPTTISDVDQYSIFFEDTIVADVVAPLLSKKMRSTNKLAGTGVNLEDALINAVVEGRVTKAARPVIDMAEVTTAAVVEDVDDVDDDDDDDEDDKE